MSGLENRVKMGFSQEETDVLVSSRMQIYGVSRLLSRVKDVEFFSKVSEIPVLRSLLHTTVSFCIIYDDSNEPYNQYRATSD